MVVQLPTLYTPTPPPSPSPVECRMWLTVIHQLAWCYVSARFAAAGLLGQATPSEARPGQARFSQARLQGQAAGAGLLGFGAMPGQASSGQAILQAGLLLHGLVWMVLLDGAGLMGLRVRPRPVSGCWISGPGL